MKKVGIVIALVLILLSATACFIQTRQDNVLESLGAYKSKQVWTSGGFQDYTDFGIYTYSSVSMKNNSYFASVTDGDIQTILSYVDDFNGWIDAHRRNDPNGELVLNYAFDPSIIDTGDFFYIYEKEGYPPFGLYDLWFFDTQSNTLYYFHNNI